MNLVLKKLAALTSATALLSAGLVGITASAANAASAPLTITFEDNDTSGFVLGNAGEYVADFEGNSSSLESSLPGGRSGKGAKLEIPAGAMPWSGTTFLKTTATAVQDGTLFSALFPYANIDVYSTVAGDMVLKMEGGCTATEIKVRHGGTGWETLHFENGSVTGCTTASFFPLFFEAGRDGNVVYLDNASFPGAETPDVVVPVTSPSTLIDFASANALTNFGGTASEIVAAPVGASAGDALKVTSGSECWGGTTIQDQATTVTLLSAGHTTVTANVHVPAAGARVRLKLESSLDNTILVETDAIASAAGWNRLSWNLSNYNAANVYNRASVFPGFSCGVDGARVTGDYYFDDIAFNGAVTPKLAPTAKITSPSKKVIAVTVANAKGKTLVISVVGVRKATYVVPVAATKTYKISVPESGTYRVSVTVGATSVVKRVTTK